MSRVAVAIGITTDGYREILGIVEGPKEDKSDWSALLRHLVDRRLSGVRLAPAPVGRKAEISVEFLHVRYVILEREVHGSTDATPRMLLGGGFGMVANEMMQDV